MPSSLNNNPTPTHNKNIMYDIVGLLKQLTKPINYTVALVLFMNTLLVIILPLLVGGQANWMGWCISIATLIISLMVVTMKWFNKLLFTILRAKGKCQLANKSDYHERITPIFADAVQRARAVTPVIRQDIELYVIENEIPIVKSCGSNIIYATTAAIDSLTDDELGAFLARECGHIGNRDFELMTLIVVSNVPNVLTILYWKVTDMFLSFFQKVFGRGDTDSALAGLACFLIRVALFCLFLPFFLWLLFIYAINLYSLRQKELSADAFSVCLGYAEAMESGLEKLFDHDTSLIDRILSPIPSLSKRIENIHNIVNSTPAATN